MNRLAGRLKKLAASAHKRVDAWLNKLAGFSPAASFSILLTLVCVGIAVGIFVLAPGVRQDFWPGLFVEFGGAIFDLLIFGILIAIFLDIRERRQLIRRYEEEIDDFKTWDSEEARHRIAGNLRRLQKLGKSDIDFRGVELSRFSFNRRDIKNIRGSVFFDGHYFRRHRASSAVLEDVDFVDTDCREVIFCQPSMFPGFVGKNLSFNHADLRGAKFDGADLSWTNTVENMDDWYEYGELEDGEPYSVQIHEPAFCQANLRGCSFREAKLERADFRDADNVTEADFADAKGLDTCFFDDDVRELVLSQAKE